MVRRALTLSLLVASGAALPAHAAPDGDPEQVVTGLATPWEVAPLPDGRLYVTERPGRIRVVAASGQLCDVRAFTSTSIEGFRKFLGLALHPDWAENRFVYLYETISSGSRILRLRSSPDGMTLTFDRVIFSGIPTEGTTLGHDGGRIAFGPDGKLYVTTGDVHNPALPRDKTKLNGKILRLEAPGDDSDGQPATGNPHLAEGGNAAYVYSRGHRHPQGLAWDAAGRLWETEHGPTGEAHAPSAAKQGHDELNLIVPGGDYGWPQAVGDVTLDGTIPPKAHSDAEAWAPADLAYAADGDLYAPALQGTHLHVFDIDGENVVSDHKLYDDVYGRMRVAVADGDQMWLTTDGAGARLLRVGIGAPLAALSGAGCPVAPVDVPTDDSKTQSGTTTTPPPSGGPPQQTPVAELPLPLPTPRSASVFTGPLDRLLGRARTSLRRRGALERLLRTGRLTVRAGGLAPGRVVLRVKTRRGVRTLTVAQGDARPRSRSAFTLRVRVTRRGRAALRRSRIASLLLDAAYQPAGGARVVRTLSLTAR